MAVVADASQIALDGVIDAVFAGESPRSTVEFGKARASGSSPAAIVSAAIRQVANLHKMKLAIEGGDSIEFAMKRAAPPVHFTRERQVSEALRVWSPTADTRDGSIGRGFAGDAAQWAASGSNRATHSVIARG